MSPPSEGPPPERPFPKATATPAPPPWERSANSLLRDAELGCRVLDSCTPENLPEELAELHGAFARGEPRAPRFRYRAPPAGDPSASLQQAADELVRRGTLGELYAARARELALEAAMCRAAGSEELPRLAALRYAPRDEHDQQAAIVCRNWIDDPEQEQASPEVRSDDEHDPRSLLSRMRQEVGRRRLPVRVVVSQRMAALAAVGPSVIYVCAARRLTVGDVERTVLHEIEGHARPRERARTMPLGIFARGTAWGGDDQEGRALVLEERANMLGPRRRRELSRRHLAALALRRGADFVETARLLDRETGAELRDALRIAARVHRGGGLGRELAYVPAYLRVGAAWQRDAGCDQVLGAGRVAVDALEVLRPWV